MAGGRGRRAALWLLTLACLAPAASAAPPEALRRQALDLAYNLDYEPAVALAREAIAADPSDPYNHLALASVVWLKLLAARGAASVEEYLGPPPRGDVRRSPPPADLSAAFMTAVDTAISLAEARLRRQPNDVDAHYALGAAVGRLAAYTATEEGRLRASIGMARRAFDAHERVLALDARRKDAGLVVGTYRYIVATLSFFKRWLAYLAGFSGNKDLAIQRLAECASYPSAAQNEAGFALLVVYTRERRYDDALRVLEDLRARSPRNRLLWLETGAMHLRAGRAADALKWLDDGFKMAAADPRPRLFGEDAMWRLTRGAALLAAGRPAEARPDAAAAVAAPAQMWVRGRAFTLLGRVEDLAGHRPAALQAYRRALDLARQTGDEPGLEDARRGLETPFTGTSARSPRQYP